MKVKEIVDRTVQFFRDKQLESPRLDAELLIARALGLRRIDLYLKFDQPLADEEVTKCRDMVRRRSTGEPVAYILGEKDFFGLTFNVDARVLVPRPETELLAEAAIDFLKKQNRQSESVQESAPEATSVDPGADAGADSAIGIGAKSDSNFEADAPIAKSAAFGIAQNPESKATRLVLDLGCGSGCLGLAIAVQVPNVKVILVDLSSEALKVARANAEKLRVQDRCQWIEGDAASVELGDWEFDVIVANPPYIAHEDPRVQASVAKFEPALALYAADQGFALIRDWAAHAIANLKETGFIGFEFGADQGPRAQEFFRSLDLSQVRLIPDLAGLPRHVVGLKG